MGRIEADPEVATADGAFVRLRALGLDDFGAFLMTLPDPRYPKLSALLPGMASQEVQEAWTGSSGVRSLQQTISFVRALGVDYSRIAGRSLDGATILDFGCGYGRAARLMYWFTDPPRLHAVDPWPEAIELCRQAGLTTNFAVSDYLPESLPVGDARFDLIYAFSVFTHLSERATLTALRTLRRYVADDGVLLTTVRPVEFWTITRQYPEVERRDLARSHRQRGFAFHPHDRPPIDGDVTYGDASMTVEWLERSAPDWTVRQIDRSLSDRYQVYVFLTPSSRVATP